MEDLKLEYNTDRKPLSIPEYGRNIQRIVDELKEIEDREERNAAAMAVIGFMGNMNPHLRDVPDFQHKLWDQLFIMADFDLDIDSPFKRPDRETIQLKPEKINYPQKNPKYRFYGNNILALIEECRKWEEGDRKEGLKLAIANHMKKNFITWNGDNDDVDDDVIYEHLKELSEGEIDMKGEGLVKDYHKKHYRKRY